MADTFRYDVFLSHNSKDKVFVERLASKLMDQERMNLFYDTWNLTPGVSWQSELQDALRERFKSGRVRLENG
jgi:hypothetical protein